MEFQNFTDLDIVRIIIERLDNNTLEELRKEINEQIITCNMKVSRLAIMRQELKEERLSMRKNYRTKPYPNWHVKSMKTSWSHLLKKKKQAFRFVNIPRMARLYVGYMPMLKNLENIEIQLNI